MREIPVSPNEVALVDDADYPLVIEYKWYLKRHTKLSKLKYAVALNPASKPRCLLMHRLIVGLRPYDGLEVDHINGNGLNNQRANLRICSHAENLRNMAVHTNAPHGVKGVDYVKQNTQNPWRARITRDYVVHHLGCFPTKAAAVEAYDSAASKVHGEFARMNAQGVA